MVVTALMVVVNCEDWAWWALKSIYDAVDHIVVTEGVAEDKWCEFDLFTSQGLSKDATASEIYKFMEEEDHENKVSFNRVGFQRSISLIRDMNLQLCPPDTDYCLVADADHIYDSMQLLRVRKMCEEFPNIRTVYMAQLLFFLDMHHVLEIGEEFRRPYGHHLSNFFFRWSPELHYNRDATFVDNQLLPAEWIHPQTEVSPEELEDFPGPVAVYPPQFHCWHTGWVGKERTIENHLLKTIWSRTLRMEWLLRKDPDRITDTDRQVWIPLVGKSREEILEVQRLYHKLWTGIFDDKVKERLVEYEWPPHLETLVSQHPFWGKSREWFGFGEML